jgi:uncharacterized protein YecE (DUF72 family)
MGEGRLLIGTSGWSYEHWRGLFYPVGLPAARRLGYYAERFSTVEINATFYGLPKLATVAAWRDAVPDDFAFAVKGSRYVTHMRKLTGVAGEVRTFFERIRLLGDKFGPVLWQLPPFLERDDALLAAFLEVLPSQHRHAVEFRHESWLEPEVYAILRHHDVAMVNVSGDMLRAEHVATAQFVYIRFHGTTRYHGSYAAPQLRPWADFIRARLGEGRDCYAYFNNDAEGHAPEDAARLLGMFE